MARSIMSSSERSFVDQISFIVKFYGNDNHVEYDYDPSTKFGKIREDLFLSPFNNINDRDRFGLEFSINRSNISGSKRSLDFKDKDTRSIDSEQSRSSEMREGTNDDAIEKPSSTNRSILLEKYNHMDMFSFKDLDAHRLSTLKFKSGERYVLTVYDRSQTTTVYADRLYRIIGSTVIICISMLFNGIFVRPLMWLIHLMLKMYRMMTDPYNETKRQRCEYGAVFNNGIYEWMFMGIMCYDMYFGSHDVSSYSAFCNIGSVLCLYHMIDIFKSYLLLNKSEFIARKAHIMKINLLEIVFMIIQCTITWSPYPFIYSALNVWVMTGDLLMTKKIDKITEKIS